MSHNLPLQNKRVMSVQSPSAASSSPVRVYLAGSSTCTFTRRALDDLNVATDAVHAAGGLAVKEVVGSVMCNLEGQSSHAKSRVCPVAAGTGYPTLLACKGDSPGPCTPILVGWTPQYASDVAAAIDKFATSGSF